MQQVAPFAVALAAGGTDGSRLSFSLDPEELGRVEVTIEREGTEAAIRIAAERPETLALLQRDRAELQRALDGAGLGQAGTSLSFSLGGHGAEERPQQGQPRAGASRMGAVTPPSATTERPRSAHRGLVDLAV